MKKLNSIDIVLSSSAVYNEGVLDISTSINNLFKLMVEWQASANTIDQEAIDAVNAVYAKVGESTPIPLLQLIDFATNMANIAKDGAMTAEELTQMKTRISAYVRTHMFSDYNEPGNAIFWSRKRVGTVRFTETMRQTYEKLKSEK